MNKKTDACCPPEQDKQPNDKYDLTVIGAGSAGFSAAITAADQGAQVALVGYGTIGGTCVNVGCVPSKTLIRATEAVHHSQVASRFTGITANAQLSDWNALRRQKDELVSSLRQAKYIDLLPAYNNIAYLEGKAKLESDGVSVDGQHIQADKVIIATGSHEFLPNIPGIEAVDSLTSTSAFEMENLPTSLIVVGGGYIGCELAQMFSRAGVEVTIVFRSRLIPEGEPEISAALSGYFTKENIAVRQIDSYVKVHERDGKVTLAVNVKDRLDGISAEKILFAAGRKPNTVGLGLEDVGV